MIPVIVRAFDFPNDFEDEDEDESEDEPTVGLALKLFNSDSLR